MSNVNYSLKRKGIRLIDSSIAWKKTKTGKYRMNSDYDIIGKVETTLPNLIVSASDKRKPVYKGDVCELPAAAKKQIVDHFYDDNGKRNRKTVAYLGIKKARKKK